MCVGGERYVEGDRNQKGRVEGVPLYLQEQFVIIEPSIE